MGSLWDFISGLGGDINSFFGGGNWLSSLLQMLQIGSQAYIEQQKANYAQDFSQEQLNAMEAGTNPAKLSNLINAMTQGMTPTEQRAIMGPAEAAASSRGMGTSPGQMQIIDEQAMAPYVQNEQQMAENAVLTGLGLPFRAQPQWPNLVTGGYSGGGSYGADPFSGLDPSLLMSLLNGGGGGGSGFDPWAAMMAGGSFGNDLLSMFTGM